MFSLMFPYVNSFYMAMEHEILQYDAPYHGPQQTCFMSDGQEISTIEWQELKNRFPSFFVHK